jgi:hypothetical protein
MGRWAVAVVALWSSATRSIGSVSAAQESVCGRIRTTRRGSLFYRARRGCHGLDAKGVSGPDLTAALAA